MFCEHVTRVFSHKCIKYDESPGESVECEKSQRCEPTRYNMHAAIRVQLCVYAQCVLWQPCTVVARNPLHARFSWSLSLSLSLILRPPVLTGYTRAHKG